MADNVMDSMKRHLMGSENRDKFKWAHKQIDKTFYAFDLDFVLVEKEPLGIVAFVDFKTPLDRITFAEVLGYESLKVIAPIYVIESSDPENGPFVVSEYKGGDFKPEPPSVDLRWIGEFADWAALEGWERALRERYRNPVSL